MKNKSLLFVRNRFLSCNIYLEKIFSRPDRDGKLIIDDNAIKISRPLRQRLQEAAGGDATFLLIAVGKNNKKTIEKNQCFRGPAIFVVLGLGEDERCSIPRPLSTAILSRSLASWTVRAGPPAASYLPWR